MELTQEQKELIVVGMELVVEEFGHDNALSTREFEVQPSQIYDYCDEIVSGDSSNIRGKYEVKSKSPALRETLTLKLSQQLEEAKKLLDVVVNGDVESLDIVAIRQFINE
jgi:hypothetical protein